MHRRLASFDASCRLTTWLFGICLRVTATARRTVRRQREQPIDESAQELMRSDSPSPEDLMVARDAKRCLDAALDCLEPEKRAVFVMFELEGIACSEIEPKKRTRRVNRWQSNQHRGCQALSCSIRRPDHR